MTEQAERTYFIDPHGHPRYSDTRRFVRRELLPALREVDPPDPPPAPSRPAPAAEPTPPPEPGPAAPVEKSRWMDDALPAPELPWRPAEPAAAPAAESIGDALRQAAEEAAEAAEAEPGLRPLFEEAGPGEPAEAPAGPAPDFRGTHDEDCPYSVAAQRCGCGAEYLATTEAEGQMLAGATSRAVDTVIGRILRRPIVPRAAMSDARILEAVGISADEWAMVEAAEAEAWRKMAAKYGTGIGPYAVEIGLAMTLITGASVRMQAGAILAARQAEAGSAPAPAPAPAPAQESEEAAE